MEKQIKSYEKFIEKASQEKRNPTERIELAKLHQEMVANFQIERLIHLIITLFFVIISLIALCLTAWLLASSYFSILAILMLLTTTIIIILTGFYIRHYYFLENHIQKLYEYTKKLHNL